MELQPDAETFGPRSIRSLRNPPPDRLSRRSTSPQAVTPLGGQESGSQDGWIHRPSPFTTTNAQQPPTYPVSAYRQGLPDLATQRLPVVHPTSYLRTRLDHTIAADGQGSRSLRGPVNTSERRDDGVPLGSSNRGYADSSATAQHHARRSQETRSVRISVNPVEVRGRCSRPRSSHRAHADSRAATQRQANRTHPYAGANISRPATRGTRRGWGPRIPRTYQVLVRERRMNEMAHIIGSDGEGGHFLSVGVSRREGWVISSVTLQIRGSRVIRVRLVYYRTVHSWRDRVETVFTAEGGEEEVRGGRT